jgi:hypothetical protein
MFFQQERLLQLFADQFTADGPDFLYRKNSRQSAIRVTADERQAFIADFARALSRIFWLLILGMVVGIAGLVIYETAFNGADQPYFTYAVFAFAFAVYMAGYYHYWNAPWRALRTRGVAGGALTRGQARAIALSKISWWQFALAALAVPFLLGSFTHYDRLTVGWNRLWLVGAALYYAMLAYQVYGKLSLGRSRTHVPDISEPADYSTGSPSWLRIVGGVFAGLVAAHLFGGIGAAVIASVFKWFQGSTVNLGTTADIRWIVRLMFYAVWLISAGAGQAVGAITARWVEVAWIVAVFNAGFFFLIYFVFGKAPEFLIPVFLPFVIAFFIRRSPTVLRKIAESRNRAQLLAFR